MEEKINQRLYDVSPYNSSDDNGGTLELERNPMPSSESDEEQHQQKNFADNDEERQMHCDDHNQDEDNKMDCYPCKPPTVLQTRRQSQRDRSFIPPRVNCPEKIVICLDISSEMDSNPFRLGDGSSYSPLMMTRRIIEIFVQSKHRMDKRHEFALVLLRESAVWMKDFVTDPKKIIDALDDINDTFSCEFLQMTSLFDIIAEKINVPFVEKSESPPPYVIRVILLYGRSQYVPQLSRFTEMYEKLVHSEYFFVDIFYLHDPPSENNKCEEIFDLLCSLDERGTSYIFEVCRNPTRLHDCMAKLLAHPLQRPLQVDAHYKLTPSAHR